MRDGKPPDDPDAAIDWLNDGAQLIVDAVDWSGRSRVWTFIGPRPAGWWIRRRLHEVAVHRADAALRAGVDFELAPELAADAISEWIELMTVQAKRQSPPVDRGHTLHLHATDEGLGPTGEWTDRQRRGRRVAGHTTTARATSRCVGPAKDLMLAICAGAPATDLGLDMFGDTAVWDSGSTARHSEWRTFSTMTTSEIATVLAWHDALNERTSTR